MEIYANLHMHTTHSDGVYTPAEIVKVAKKEGYKAVAITDHDSATGYSELEKACKEEDLDCLFGVEFSVRYSEEDYCHIVAVDFDAEYPPMKEYLEKMGARQTDNTKKCFDEGVEKGDIAGITWDEILEANKGVIWLCNNHVFKVMKAKGLVKQENYMEWFRTNFGMRGYKYEPLYPFNELKEMVRLIKAAGGLAILAHPHNLLDKIDFFVDCGIEGIEVWHPDLTEEEKERAYKIALEKKLYISGGSDHSGFCGGLYDSFPSEEALKKSCHYIEPLSVGTTKEYFMEIKERRINR